MSGNPMLDLLKLSIRTEGVCGDCAHSYPKGWWPLRCKKFGGMLISKKQRACGEPSWLEPDPQGPEDADQ